VKRDDCKDFVLDPSTNNKNSGESISLATKGKEVKQVTLKDPVVGSKQAKIKFSLGEAKSQAR
jgi:hypothetical protein